MPIPPTGTFRILVKVVASINGEFQQGIPAGNCAADILPAVSNNDIVAYLNENLGGVAGRLIARQSNAVFCAPDCFGLYPVAGMHGFTFNPATDEFIFNPGGSQVVVDTLSSDFPLGFMCTALQVVWTGLAFDGFGSGNDLPEIRLKYSGLTVRTSTGPNLNKTSLTSLADAIMPTDTYQGLPSALGIFGIEADIEANSVISTGCGDFNSAQCTFYTSKLYVQGEYVLWSTGLNLTPNSVTNFTELTSTIFTLTDTDNKLLQLTNLYVNDIALEITNIITHTAGIITFTLPVGTPLSSPLTIVGLSDGTEFTGTTELGSISVILVNGSGLYTLVPGKKYDTYYDRSTDPVGTIDLAIPTPKFKTGYFGG